MVITKDSTTAKIFKEFLVATKTQKATSVPTLITFYKGKGIRVQLDDDINSFFIKDKNVDLDFSIQGSFAVSAICAPLDEKDTEIVKDGDKISINGIHFESSSSDENTETVTVSTPHIIYSKEQLLKIEPDFDITIGNYFISPTMTDVVAFAINEGSLYRFASSSSCWKISNVGGEIDKVQIEQDYGHTTKIWVLPHKIFNFMKLSETIKMYFTEYNSILVESNDFALEFKCRNTKTAKFKSYLNYINSVPEKTISFNNFTNAKKLINDISKNSFEMEEDINVAFNFKDKIGFDVSFDSAKITFEDTNIDFTKSFEFNLQVINYLFNNLSEKASLIERGGDIEIIDNNSYYFLLNFDYDRQ